MKRLFTHRLNYLLIKTKLLSHLILHLQEIIQNIKVSSDGAAGGGIPTAATITAMDGFYIPPQPEDLLEQLSISQRYFSLIVVTLACKSICISIFLFTHFKFTKS